VVLYNVKPLVIFLTLGGALGQSKKFPPVGNSDFSLWITFLHQAFVEHLGGHSSFTLCNGSWPLALRAPYYWNTPALGRCPTQNASPKIKLNAIFHFIGICVQIHFRV